MNDDPQLFVRDFHTLYPDFRAGCEQSLRDCGDYSNADVCSFPGIPILLFEDDAVFGNILLALDGGTQNGLLPEFEAYIARQDEMCDAALELYAALLPNKRSIAAPVHDLFPFHLAVTGMSGPWPLVHIKALLDAYHWAHSPVHANQMRRDAPVPGVFSQVTALPSVSLFCVPRLGAGW